MADRFNLEDKIKETVEIGSVFLALENNYFTHEELLKWLTTAEISGVTKVAYKAVCEKILPNNQYLDDGSHFLLKQKEYVIIAMYYGLDVYIFETTKIDCDVPLIISVCDILSPVSRTPEYLNNRKEDVTVVKGANKNDDNLLLGYKAHEFNHISELTSEEINKNLVSADWLEKFRYNENLIKIIMKRLSYLHDNHINYYNFIYKFYQTVIKKLYKDKLITSISREELHSLDQLFPNIVDKRILSYDGLNYKLSLLGNDISAYVLGFPIQYMIPNEEQIHQLIKLLNEKGIEEYSKLICSYNGGFYKIKLPFGMDENINLANNEDTLMENIDNYVAFDIVAYQKGNYIYRFTRPEFERLLESKKNHWTNELLPVSLLSTIESRIKTVKELGLPPSRTLYEMLKYLETDNLFVATKPEQKDESEDREMEGRMMLEALISFVR